MLKSKGVYVIAVLTLSALVSLDLRAGAQEAGSQDAGATRPATPEFKSEKAKESFAAAMDLYKKGEYKDAKKSFKKAASGAKTKEDKATVASWVDACDGAVYVERVKLLMKQNRLQAAHEYAAKIQSRCRGNPAEALFGQTIQELENQLFLTLESFDYRDSRYSAKYGKTFVNDARIVIRGKHCLRWMSTKDGKAGVLKLKSVPKDLNRYDAIEFWMNYRVPPTAQIVVTCGKEQSKKGGGMPDPRVQPKGKVQDAFFGNVRFAPKAGQWQLVRVPFAQMKASGRPSLAAAKDIRIQIPGNKTFDFFIDEIRLMRKDPTSAVDTAPKGRG